jgi:hypothetical protein
MSLFSFGSRVYWCADGCINPDGSVQTSPCVTTPALPITGYSNPRCYASDLNDCNDKTTNEH